MTSRNCNGKMTCENCGTRITKFNLVRHNKSCSAGTSCCPQCLNFFRKIKNILNCTRCYQRLPGFYFLRQHKKTQHAILIKTKSVDPDDYINEVDDANLKEELRSCQHFLVDSELERSRHKAFIYAIDNLNAEN